MVVSALVLRMFGRRSEIVDDALAAVHFPEAGETPTILADLANLKVHHVFCATELQTGDHLYFTPRLSTATGWDGARQALSPCRPRSRPPRAFPGPWFHVRSARISLACPGPGRSPTIDLPVRPSASS